MAAVKVANVEAELGRPISDQYERAQVERWIASCELLISTRLRRPLENLDQGALDVVIPQVVARKVLNPEGKTSERIDDYYYTRDVAGYGLGLTEEEWAMLTPEDVREKRGAFCISTIPPSTGACW